MNETKIVDRQLQQLLEALPEAVLLESDDGLVLWLNAALIELFELRGEPADHIDTSSNTLLAEMSEPLVNGRRFARQNLTLEAEYRPANSQEVLFNCGTVAERDYTPLTLASGESAHLWHYRDVTSQRRLVAELDAAERLAIHLSLEHLAIELGGRYHVHDVIEAWLRDYPAVRHRLAHAANGRGASEISTVARRVRPSAEILGAARLAKLLGELERQPHRRAASFATVHATLTSLRRLEAILQDWLATDRP
jgi:hypothetical protein